ncbi:DUF3261 domain-containing protein [Chitinibacter sp. S2-10]|uniref:DUF3261 domain-containing protein n=1 Tax=Chitinibacter sp. S2-10 TaxID=3373597 RepID=UPI003977BFD7
MRALLLTVLSTLLLACTSEIPAPMLPVSAFGSIAQNELITLEAGDRVFAFTARLESDGETLKVVAITPTGQRLFSITRTGEQLLTEPGVLWPRAMPLQAVWADIEMVHAPAAMSVASPWQRIRNQDSNDWLYHGKKLAQVKHEAGKITLTRDAYTLTIEILPE